MRKVFLALIVLMIVLLSLQVVFAATASRSLSSSTGSAISVPSRAPSTPAVRRAIPRVVAPPVAVPPSVPLAAMGAGMPRPLCGDADVSGSSVMNILDALATSRAASGLQSPNDCMLVRGVLGPATILDALKIAQTAAGLPVDFDATGPLPPGATNCPSTCLNNPYAPVLSSLLDLDSLTRRAPAIIDIDGDGDKDIVAMSDSRVRAWDTNGVQIFNFQFGSGPNNGLAVYDLDGNDGGRQEIVFSKPTGESYILEDDGVRSRPVMIPLSGTAIDSILNDPIIADVDPIDVEMEIIIYHTDASQIANNLLIYNHDASRNVELPINTMYASGGPARSVAVGNIDSDSANEIVIATGDDKIIVVDGLSIINQVASAGASEDIVDMILANIDGDLENEIIYVTHDTVSSTGMVHVIGSSISPNQWGQAPTQISNNPASYVIAGNIDSDPSTEIIVTASEGGQMYVFGPDGTAEFPSVPGYVGSGVANFVYVGRDPASQVIANIDDDAESEIVLGVSDINHDGVTGDSGIIVLNNDGTSLPFYPLTIPAMVNHNAVHTMVDDLNGDGNAEIAVLFNRFVGGRADIFILTERNNPFGGSIWPTYRQNPQRTGSLN